VINKWNKAITAPSYSKPFSVFYVIGENDFQAIFSQILIAMNKEIPDPLNPYPFDINSSNNKTIIDANVNYNMIKIAFPAPSLSNSPYMPDQT